MIGDGAEIGGMKIGRGKPKYSEKTCPSAAPELILVLFIWLVRLLALQPLLAYCASLG
jgi:hypothetical protein